jgi:hypothetical protein
MMKAMEAFELAAFDASPRSAWCERCGAGNGADLQRLVLQARSERLSRTFCELCAEELLEAMLETDRSVEAIPLLEAAEAARFDAERACEEANALCAEAEHQCRRARRAAGAEPGT